jgi:AraC-like DNA-binding protein
MPAKRIIGMPIISDGHQQHLERSLQFDSCPNEVLRILLIEGSAVTIEHVARRRLNPPVLVVVPPRWGGRIEVAKGGFCYRLDLDGGPVLAELVGGEPLLLHGQGTGPWRSDIIALAQRWWLSLEDRRRVAIQLAALLTRLVDAGRRPGGIRQPLDARFQVLVQDHLGSGERAVDLARRLGVSRITLDRALRRRTGASAAAWLRVERLRAAADLLLRLPHPVGEIAGRCGFTDGDSFVRAFKRLYGCTPRVWRARAVTQA